MLAAHMLSHLLANREPQACSAFLTGVATVNLRKFRRFCLDIALGFPRHSRAQKFYFFVMCITNDPPVDINVLICTRIRLHSITDST